MAWQKNISNMGEGSFRSILGAAAENLFFGRAQIAGFPCLSKEWRDMECDGAVLSGNALYRVEIKGSSTDTFKVTHGQRGGVQINKEIDKERTLSVEDCDFTVGVDTCNGDCYIVPIDIVAIYGRDNLSKSAIGTFREKWQLFLSGNGRLTEEEIKNGLLKYTVDEIEVIAKRLGISLPGEDYAPVGTKGLKFSPVSNKKELFIVLIWEHLANSLVEGQDLNETC